MMMAYSCLFLSACLAVGCAAAVAPSKTEPAQGVGSAEASVTPGAHAEAVRSLAQPFVDGEWAKAVAIALVTPAGVETYGLGRARDDSADPPDADTVFEIGSVSKVFTALLLADAVVRKDVALEAPIDDLLPKNVHGPSKEGRGITLRDLATHTSGLPRLPANLAPASEDNPYVDYTRDKLMAYLPEAKLDAVPGSAYAYSNLGAGLLGQLLADRAHSEYGALVQTRIAKPLGMTRTGVVFPAQNFAQGHDSEGNPVRAWDQASLAGAGAVRSSVRDLSKLVTASLTPAKDELGAAIELTHRRHTQPSLQGVGLGWHIGLGPGALASVLWHNGETAGAHAFVALDPEKKSGVIVLANTGQARIDALGVALVRTLRGEQVKADLPPTVVLTEAALEPCAGTYRVDATFAITVTREGARLFLQATGQPRLRLYASSETEFYLREVDAKITFERGNGAMTGLTLHQAGQHIPAKRASR